MRSPRRFHELFGTAPAAVVRAPGRVNLIGEHLDYAGLSVLPMAIERRITLYVGPRADGRVRVVNVRPERGEREFAIEEAVPPWPAGDWGNYLKAAVQGLVDDGRLPTGFDALLSSDLPAAAGLASSSALVVATALAALAAGQSDEGGGPSPSTDPLALAALLARAEHYVGARGGGMDQAAILAGLPGHAMRIEFDPLRVEHVRVPDDWTFVVAHSLETAEKSGAAREIYNTRRAEVERALRELHAGPGGYTALLARFDRDELGARANGALHDALRRRFRHLMGEADRVNRAEAAMRTNDPTAFGNLMLASHDSLRDDFDVSTPALDALVAASIEAGALGARLTGAGLGGCVLALVRSQRVAEFLTGLADAFYAPRKSSATDDHLFAVEPGPGARVERI